MWLRTNSPTIDSISLLFSVFANTSIRGREAMATTQA